MKIMRVFIYNQVFIVIIVLCVRCAGPDRITPSLEMKSGSVNGAFIERNGKILAIYGDPSGKINDVEMVLFTHFRRDLTRAGLELLKNGAKGVIPSGESIYFKGCDSVWNSISENRFHDYYCQTSKILTIQVKDSREVKGGDVIFWEDIEIDVLSTPGYTRNAVTYITKIDGKKIAFTGDLIFNDGKLFDLYSFQDSYHDIGGYHGYASRLGSLIKSLQIIADQNPDIIIPARGPVIKSPLTAIDTLISRVRKLYCNYLSISAYRWYFPDRVSDLANYIPGAASKVEFMPYSEIIREDPPEWYIHVSNSNLVIASDSTAFLIDCGTTDALDGVMNMVKSGRIKTIEGIFITHYHDDHTDYINDVREKFGCPVYITEELKDILENPGSYRMPCLSKKAVNNLTIKKHGERMKWKDFTLTFYYFPGQTIYHDAVLFDKTGGESIFFIGDSFTPSGIDDYCLLNRNLLHEGSGYFYCLDILNQLPAGTLLANQHVEPPFSYSAEQLDFMRNKLKERNNIFRDLFPWDDINYGVDEQWARTYPYGQKANPGSIVEIAVKILNHSPVEKEFIIRPLSDDLIIGDRKEKSVSIGAGEEGSSVFKINIPDRMAPGIYVLTFDIEFEGHILNEWCEAILKIED